MRTSDCRLETSNSRFEISDFKSRISNLRFQISNARAACVALALAALCAAVVAGAGAAQPQARRIREVQGRAHVSPLDGRTVAGLSGVVTLLRPNGFFMQDAQPDSDPKTSEGVFVSTSAQPGVRVGDAVRVAGRVREQRQGAAGPNNANLSVTQIESTDVSVVSGNNPLPAPTRIGAGGRVPPKEIIEDDATSGDAETSGTFDPEADGLDFYESLEGMLVRVDNAVAVGPAFSRRDGEEVPVLGDRGAGASLRTPRGGIIIRPRDFNPERIALFDAERRFAGMNVGAGFAGPTVGVLDYFAGGYKVIVSNVPNIFPGTLRPEVTRAARTGQLAVAAFNVENLDPGDDPAKFRLLARVVVRHLRSPDLISVEEIQDNNGSQNDSVVDASETFRRLVAAIRAAGGPAYQFRDVPPVDDQDGGEPGGNIRIGFLFRTDRGLRFVERPGGGPLVGTRVVGPAGSPRLSASPGRVEPTLSVFAASRKPLAGEFTFRGQRLFVIANHFGSKGGDQPLFGRFQPPTLLTEPKRAEQARVVAGFVREILMKDRLAKVCVLGDLNDFEFSEPVTVLKAAGLRALIERLPPAERYTYVFDGNSQALDHILVSPSLAAAVAGFDVVHINSEFADAASDHDPTVALFALR